MRSETPPPSPRPQSSAPASVASPEAGVGGSGILSSSAMAASNRALAGLVDQHLLDQDGVDLGGGDDEVDPLHQFHAQLVAALAARQVFRPQLAQEGLEHVLQPRHVLIQ